MAKRQKVIEANRDKLKPNRGLGAIVHRPWFLSFIGSLCLFQFFNVLIGITLFKSASTFTTMFGLMGLMQLGLALFLLVPVLQRLGMAYRLEFPTLCVRRFGRVVGTYNSYDFANAKWLHKGKWFRARLQMPDGRMLRPVLITGDNWNRLFILVRFMEAQIAPPNPQMEVAQRRLEYIANELEFDLVPGVRYCYGFTPSTIRPTDQKLLTFLAACGIGALPTWAAQEHVGWQSPLTRGLAVLGILLVAGYSYYALSVGRRLELPRDEFEFDGEELVVYRDRVARYRIPVPAWEPPQSAMKAVQDFKVNGRTYRIDRSALIAVADRNTN